LVCQITLKEITKKDEKFLYDLLKQRKTNENISHKKMPTFKEHQKFMLKKPYFSWYVIFNSNKKIGSAYLSHQNEIAIWFKKELENKTLYNNVLKLILEKNPRNRYLVNINPNNKKLIKYYTKNNFKLIQYTYELIR
jgi:hypothetical protein